jgi:hypothetical protein
VNIRVLVATGAVGALASIGAGSAVAQAPPATPDPSRPAVLPPLGPSLVTLTDSTSAKGRQVTRSAGHPCYGQTDNPHNSSHYPGYALVSSRTVCAPHTATVTVDLYRYLFGSWYWLDRGGPVTRAGTAQTNARWRCPGGSRQTFLGVGYHSAPPHYPASTSNQATFTCS